MKLRNSLYNNTDCIIVFVQHGDSHKWFISDRIFWILDYGKYARNFDPNNVDFSERFDIEVVNSETINTFLEKMKDYAYDTEFIKSELKEGIRMAKSWDEMSWFLPSLYVNSNTKELCSLYSEGVQFENYTPLNWKGVYGAFYNKIPPECKYWIYDNIDFYQKIITSTSL